MPSNQPDPDAFAVPSVGELDAMREAYDMTPSEFSQEAGREPGAWSEIVREDIDPRASTIVAFLEVLQDTDPHGPRTERGRPMQLEAQGGGSR